MPEIDINTESLQDVIAYNQAITDTYIFYTLEGTTITKSILGTMHPNDLMDAWEASVNKRIKTSIVGDVAIKTVFMGFDISADEGDCILFSTTALGGSLRRINLIGSTYAEAVAAHDLMVEWVKNKLLEIEKDTHGQNV